MGKPWENHGKTMVKPWENGSLMGFDGMIPSGNLLHMENHHAITGKTQYKLQCSIANYYKLPEGI